MNVLLLGSGGREHAIALKLADSPKLERLYIAPGNAGTLQLGENVDLDIMNNDEVVDFAKSKSIDLVVVGPEGPLVNGVVDALEKEEIKALARITELAKTLIGQFGKDAKYQFGGADFAHRIQGLKGYGGNEGAGYSVVGAENAVKLMAELGVTNLNRVNRMSRNMMGEAAHSPFAARGGFGATVEGGMFQSGENAMKELTGMLEGIKAAKMKLIDIDRSGVPITMEQFNRRSQVGTQLNQAASNKVDIGGSGGGGASNMIDTSSTQIVNNTTVIPPIDTDGGRGRGLGISG